jgi:hypothetical protein
MNISPLPAPSSFSSVVRKRSAPSVDTMIFYTIQRQDSFDPEYNPLNQLNEDTSQIVEVVWP